MREELGGGVKMSEGALAMMVNSRTVRWEDNQFTTDHTILLSLRNYTK